MGTFAKDTHETASKAALVGGTTTLIEMICPCATDEPAGWFSALAGGERRGNVRTTSRFHMGVTRFDEGMRSSCSRLLTRPEQFLQNFSRLQRRVRDRRRGTLPKRCSSPKKLGVITTAHCENDAGLRPDGKELLAEGKTGPEWHHESRPPLVEAEGVHHLMTFAEMTGAHVYIVHLSCDEALREALAARHRGVHVSGSKRSFSTCSLTRLTPSGRTSRAPSSSCRRRCATRRTSRFLGMACAAVDSGSWPPITRRSIFRNRNRWAAKISPGFRMALRRSKIG